MSQQDKQDPLSLTWFSQGCLSLHANPLEFPVYVGESLMCGWAPGLQWQNPPCELRRVDKNQQCAPAMMPHAEKHYLWLTSGSQSLACTSERGRSLPDAPGLGNRLFLHLSSLLPEHSITHLQFPKLLDGFLPPFDG